MRTELKSAIGYLRAATFWYYELDELPAKKNEGEQARTAVAAKFNRQMKVQPASSDAANMKELIQDGGRNDTARIATLEHPVRHGTPGDRSPVQRSASRGTPGRFSTSDADNA